MKPIPQLSENDIIRFWGYVKKTDTCWLWVGYKCNGYGQFWIQGQFYRPSRVCYSICIRDPGKLQLNHIRECNNTLCINPDHLYPGSQKQNIRDSMNLGNHYCTKPHKFPGCLDQYGEKNNSCKYTTVQINKVKELLAMGYRQYLVAITCNVSRYMVGMIARGESREYG